MEVDWVTVSAQIINFLVLVWLLRRFLYRPVVRAMARREERIAQRLDEAEEREKQARQRAEQYESKRDQLEDRREEILAEAKEEAEKRRKELLEQAREEAAEARAEWQRQGRQEKEAFLNSLRQHTAEGIQAIAGKVVRDLADAELEERVVHVFVERLKELDKRSRDALASGATTVHVSSAFPLGSNARARLTRAVHDYVAEGVEVDYSESSELLLGIELSSGQQRLSWNAAEYMEELHARIEKALEPVGND